MKHLIDKYQKEIDRIEGVLDIFKSNGSINDIKKEIRLKTELSAYKTFLDEIRADIDSSLISDNGTVQKIIDEAGLSEIFKDITIRLIGHNVHRLNPDNDCPVEELNFTKVLNKWLCNKPNFLNQVIFGSDSRGFPKEYLTGKEEKIVASFIQWLGSPVGFGFVSDVYNVRRK